VQLQTQLRAAIPEAAYEAMRNHLRSVSRTVLFENVWPAHLGVKSQGTTFENSALQVLVVER
jgi:hypothetical protein